MPVNDVYSLLRFEEGEKLYAYDDFDGALLKAGTRCVGHPSIGVGRSLDIEGITRDESDAMLTHDVQKWTTALNQHPWFLALDHIRQAAMVSMAHAVGIAGLFSFTDMVSALSRQDWQGAHDAMLASKWASEESARGSKRVQRCAQMLLNGLWPAV